MNRCYELSSADQPYAGLSGKLSLLGDRRACPPPTPSRGLLHFLNTFIYQNNSKFTNKQSKQLTGEFIAVFKRTDSSRVMVSFNRTCRLEMLASNSLRVSPRLTCTVLSWKWRDTTWVCHSMVEIFFDCNQFLLLFF